MSVGDYLGTDVMPEILAFLDFKLASTDYEFLKRYMHGEWSTRLCIPEITSVIRRICRVSAYYATPLQNDCLDVLMD
jgi:hypothetical protein